MTHARERCRILSLEFKKSPAICFQVVCYYLIANWWVPYGLEKLNPVFWGNFGGPGGLDWWFYPLRSYLDVDRDGKVSIKEFYDLKTVQILKAIFVGLDANGDGLVKQNEACLESFLQPQFLRAITQELFDFADINNDDQISVDDYPQQCQPGGSSFCMRILPLADKIEENCRLLVFSFQTYLTLISTSDLKS